MDRLIKQRKPIRASFTKTNNSLNEKFESSEIDLDSVNKVFAKLERLFGELKTLDENIMEKLLDAEDDEIQAEYSSAELFQDTFDAARFKVGNLLSKVSHVFNENASVSGNKCSVCSSPNTKRKLRLPKIDLKRFGGDIKDWLSFWSQFKRIHEDKSIEAEDKFQYLINAMIVGSKAHDIIDSFPATAENYEKAIDVLKKRFGREELLTEHYVRELISLVIKNTNSAKGKINVSQLYDKLESHLRALESIGMTRDKYAAMLFPLVESCIPEEVLRAWIRSPLHRVTNVEADESKNIYSSRLQQLLTFLRCEVEGEERISMAKSGLKVGLVENHSYNNRESKYKKTPEEYVPTASNLFSGEKGFSGRPSNNKQFNLRCVFCDKTHESRDCFDAQKMPLNQKREILSLKKACFICLKVGHQSKFCKSSLKCKLCGKKHFTIMCSNLPANVVNTQPIENKLENVSTSNSKAEGEYHSTSLASQSKSENQQVLLQTLLVNVSQEPSGKFKTVRALIDSGSQKTYILERTANELGCTPVAKKELVHTLFGGVNSKKKVHCCYDVSLSSLLGDYKCNVSVLDQSTICSSLPRLTYGSWIEELKRKNIFLSDYGEGQPEIELLIGADTLGPLLTGRTYKLTCGLIAVQTQLGWTVMGNWSTEECRGKQFSSYGAMITSLFIQSEQIPDLWSLDVLGITDPYQNKTKEEIELAAMQHFKDTVKVNDDGRYVVKLPWVENQENLGSNRDVVEKRLKSATVKLLNENKFNDYENVFKFWESTGIIEQINDKDNTSSYGYYLPHRAVIKEQSSTKIRPVFDASSKSKGTLSLNDCLEKGPNLIEDIPSILIRFRERNIGVTSDIEKAFLQISVHEHDREYLRFLWWDDYEKQSYKVYQHCRVVFGVNCSPFILGATVNHLLESYSVKFPETTAKLKESFYVDNCVTAVDTETELHNFKKDSIEIMSGGKFNLRDWKFSGCNSGVPVGVLGLLWDTKEDTLFCNIAKNIVQEPVSRRTILSTVHKVFDPIGFTCPITLNLKLLLQTSWRSKLSWDDTVPEEIKNKFVEWNNELPKLSEVKIPRCMIIDSTNKNEKNSLHTFCDASKNAFSAVVFVRSELNGNVQVQMVMAKSRVAPLKEMTIPRLELMACCIGARLACTVSESLNREVTEQYFWTDSTTVLWWINNKGNWRTFVQNRVLEIQKLTNGRWFHVSGADNPADLPSRGCSIQTLIDSHWWEGPTWLKMPKENWPMSSTFHFDENEVNVEKKEKNDTVLTTSSEEECDWYVNYFSKYTKIIRMVAWMKRFAHNARNLPKDRMHGELNVSEIENAEKKIIIHVQKELLKNKKSLSHICTFQDSHGILRLKTKISSLKMEEANFKYPIVLPHDHRVVRLLIQQQHENLAHAGVNVLMLKLREKFWILQSRRAIRKVISKCVKCKRFAAKSIITEPVSLPEDRVSDATVFEVIGVDLAGPLFLKDGSKAWITVYTCAVYRAVHLELISSLSTNGFLLGFRRFIARRGRPKTVYSDNGTNFIGTDNLFKNIDWKYIERESSTTRIQWKFIPPTGAWWGGWWERIVQMVKNLLRRVLGRASLSYEELSSVLCDCEFVINSRPLTYISEETDDITPLSPLMFLQDNLATGVPDLDLLSSNSLSKRLRHQQNLRNQLRKRFKTEYLSQLVLRPNKGEHNYKIQENDVVLVGSDNTKRVMWPLARVKKVYPGKDGVIRVVKLKTATSELIRPVQRLYPLEVTGPATVTDEESEDSSKKDNLQIGRVTSSRGRCIKLPLNLKDFVI